MGDYPIHLVRTPSRPRFGRLKAAVIVAATLVMCLPLTGAVADPVLTSDAFAIQGMDRIPSPPTGGDWAPAFRTEAGLKRIATAGNGRFALHTAGGDVTFLPGVNLGSTTPGHQPGELSITRGQYRAWFAAMGWLGLRVVRVYTIHPPAFYQELARYNRATPDRPLYLMQGVYFPDESYIEKRNLYDRAVTSAFQAELKDASDAVAGHLARKPQRGPWDTDVLPWLAGWVVGVELDPYAAAASDRRNAAAPQVKGKFFRGTPEATPTERWLAARMNELATHQAARGMSQPIAFTNWPTTDPLRHPDEPLEQEDLFQLDANHVRATAAWPAGTFASYHAYPYYPDFQRYEFRGRPDPYAAYLSSLKRHHGTMPVLVTEFGVPSSIGSAHNSPLGRSQGDHSEREAMRIDAELLRVIHDQGLGGGFLFGWADEWFKFTWNTIEHQDPDRRQLWHDPYTNEQNFGLIAMDPAGQPDTPATFLFDTEGGWPARRVSARIDESYAQLRIGLGDPAPANVTLSFDVLPSVVGSPPPGWGDRMGDAALTFDLVNRTGQAYLRDVIDPLPLDYPNARRAPGGWQRFELIVNRAFPERRLPAEIINAGALRYGSWNPDDEDSDSRSLWRIEDGDLVVRVPWALLGYADPSAHMVGLPRRQKLKLVVSPGAGVVVSATGTDQFVGDLTWVNWNRPYWTERLKQGAESLRDAALELTGPA